MMEILYEKTEQEFLESIVRLRNMLQKGDGKAGLALTVYLDPDNEVIPLEWRKRLKVSDELWRQTAIEAFHCLHEEARDGDGESMHLTGQYYQTGMPPVSQDMEKFQVWCERAVRAGYAFAAHDLQSESEADQRE